MEVVEQPEENKEESTIEAATTVTDVDVEATTDNVEVPVVEEQIEVATVPTVDAAPPKDINIGEVGPESAVEESAPIEAIKEKIDENVAPVDEASFEEPEKTNTEQVDTEVKAEENAVPSNIPSEEAAPTDVVPEIESREITQEGVTEVTQEVASSTEAVQEVTSSADIIQANASSEVVQEVSSSEVVQEVSSTEAVQEVVTSTETVQEVVTSETIHSSSTEVIQEVASSEAVEEVVTSAEAVLEVSAVEEYNDLTSEVVSVDVEPVAGVPEVVLTQPEEPEDILVEAKSTDAAPLEASSTTNTAEEESKDVTLEATPAETTENEIAAESTEATEVDAEAEKGDAPDEEIDDVEDIEIEQTETEMGILESSSFCCHAVELISPSEEVVEEIIDSIVNDSVASIEEEAEASATESEAVSSEIVKEIIEMSEEQRKEDASEDSKEIEDSGENVKETTDDLGVELTKCNENSETPTSHNIEENESTLIEANSETEASVVSQEVNIKTTDVLNTVEDINVNDDEHKSFEVEKSKTTLETRLTENGDDIEKELMTDNIAVGESGACSLEATCESPTDDLQSDRGSEEGGVSTDEGIVASDEDEKEEKSDFDKVDKSKKSKEVKKEADVIES